MNEWSDPASWSDGKVPGPNDVAVIDREIVLDRDVTVCGMRTVADVGNLIFDPASSCKLSVCCNVVNEGAITMHPRASSAHEILFTGIDETKFVGGGNMVMDMDVGLWTMNNGILDVEGTDRVSWVRSATGWDPTWLDTDTVLLAPNNMKDFGVDDRGVSTFAAFKRGQVVPRVIYDGVQYFTEALNLTRNVIIGGAGDGSASPLRNGRAHVMFMMTKKQQRVRNVLFHDVGPRAATGNVQAPTAPILGRWGLHFHRCEDSSRGSLIENVVVKNCGSHSFVAHKSHGVTFKQCLSYDSWESAFWWDPDSQTKDPKTGAVTVTLNQSDDVTYDSCCAALVRSDPAGRGYRSTGFELGYGQRNKVVGCVAIGVQGNLNSSGFYWQEAGDLRPFVTNPKQYATPWAVNGCVSHNNRNDGAFIWQNKQTRDVITNFLAYRNGRAGLEHGAYANTFQFITCWFYENAAAGIILSAVSHPDADPTNRLRFSGCIIDGDISPPIYSGGHFATTDFPYGIFENCVLRSKGETAVAVAEPAGSSPGKFAFIHCKFNGRDLSLGDMKLICAPGSSYVVQDSTGVAKEVAERTLPAGWIP